MVDLLAHPEAHRFGGRVAVIGGGATAVDCAITARDRGAEHVELFMLEKLSEMPLTSLERQELIDNDIEVNGRIRITRILATRNAVSGLETLKVTLPEGMPFKPANVRDVPGTQSSRIDFRAVIVAIGMRSAIERIQQPGVFYAGDITNGPTTVVEAVASGKNAALEIDAYIKRAPDPQIEKQTKST